MSQSLLGLRNRMTARAFLDGRVTLYSGDCLPVLATLPEASIDSVVCDPPYHLTSIVKRFSAENAAACKVGKTGGAYARASAGFMGKKWDGGDVAFRVETWTAVLRALKPGGHLVAFSGTRTYHRMVCAIEDAGFEIRDQIGWAFGSGFPKSRDVSKDIDKRRFGSEDAARFKADLATAVAASGKTRHQINAECGFTMRFDISFEKDPIGWGVSLPTPEQYDVICRVLGCDASADVTALREWPRSKLERLYEVVGYERRMNAPNGVVSAGRESVVVDRKITRPGTDQAKKWEGWGTALKPAWEPIVLARRPLIGTVAENVLQHGTGAINIGACRIETGDDLNGGAYKLWSHYRREDHAGRSPMPGDEREGAALGMFQAGKTAEKEFAQPVGRWPANLIHDGSEEVLAAFPDAAGQLRAVGPEFAPKTGTAVYGDYGPRPKVEPRDDGGSAARFFYTAKADSEDRLGSKHPTVKPLDLMQWLVRLVTPKGGVVLDPFAGTGTTGEAAWREGMNAILIEREEEYQADISRRMELAANPTKRAAVAKTKNNLDRPEDLPLFAELAP